MDGGASRTNDSESNDASFRSDEYSFKDQSWLSSSESVASSISSAFEL